MEDGGSSQKEAEGARRLQYEQIMLDIRAAFEGSLQFASAGQVAVAARSAAVDRLIGSLWAEESAHSSVLRSRLALVAVGGYGRRELFPFSDVDLMFLLDPRVSEKEAKEPIRRLNQRLWDCGLRLSPMTRTLSECERFQPENVEFTLALLDARFLAGDFALCGRLTEKAVPRLLQRERKRIVARLVEVTTLRHRRYGDTLFHLEPNIKDAPGGLRDAHVCAWLGRLAVPMENGNAEGLTVARSESPDDEFGDARDFLLLVRTFLHLRHGRDDNALDWQAQDEAAAVSLGIENPGGLRVDAGYWMRMYFRRARGIDRAARQAIEEALPAPAPFRLPGMAALRRLGERQSAKPTGFELRQDRIHLNAAYSPGDDPAEDPEVMLAVFATIATTSARLSRETEQRLEGALPRLSAHLEDGPGLWRHLERILTGPRAGFALRTMHAMGILELLIPEFHAIDALVIRDAYHRYTVDEHTFVLIDTLHALNAQAASAGAEKENSGLAVWAARYASILRDLPHPGLLFLAALLHDTGKGHSASGHAVESVRRAESVVKRLELDSYESGLVLGLIRNHLEMSAALRRDVFDGETVRAFAARVHTPEALRMLTLFTYADISAVHPDALTPWKAENLHHLYLATAHYLDRNVDDERVGTAAETAITDILHRVSAKLPQREADLHRFFAGLPQRYLLTRKPEQILSDFELAQRLQAQSIRTDGTTYAHDLTRGSNLQAHEAVLRDGAVQIDFRYAPGASEITLVSRDRPMLFASMAGALAAWGMNIITADAYSNAQGIVVDTFRFVDSFRTLELNEPERARFVDSVRGAMTGALSVEAMLSGRRRERRAPPKVAVETRIDFDDAASKQSTLLEVVAQDTSGLLRAISLTLAALACNIKVALIDTEGEMAIDVFYVTHNGAKISADYQETLRRSLLEAIEQNAS